MGSKKHHKEKKHKKEKRRSHSRSRSRSRSSSPERESRRHRHDKHERRQKEKEKERHERKSKEREKKDDGIKEKDNIKAPPPSQQSEKPQIKQEKEEEPEESGNQRGDSSLSVEETNKLRAKLGLKPLQTESTASKSGGKDQEGGKREPVHKPAPSLTEDKRTKEIRERIEKRRSEREIASKLEKVKKLAGDSDDEEDSAANWVAKSRKIENEKKVAQQRAKLLDEMDADFGVGSLVDEDFKPQKKEYSAKNLSGFKIQHSLEDFKEGKTTILTLADRGVLEEGEDVLENVNMVDDEHAEENKKNRVLRPDYKAWQDDENQFDEYGMLKEKAVLSKYDEEIEGKTRKSFVLGKGGNYDSSDDKKMDEIRAQLQAHGETLEAGQRQRLAEYYTKDEMATFKKPKKKKVRKALKRVRADDLVPLDDHDQPEPPPKTKLKAEFQSRGLLEPDEVNIDDDDPMEDAGKTNSQVKLEEEDITTELETALAKARKLKKLKVKKERVDYKVDLAEKIIARREVKQEDVNPIGFSFSLEELNENKARQDGKVVFNSVAEYCRSLGDIPTYGLSGNRPDQERDEIEDFEMELLERAQRRREEEEEEMTSGWKAVQFSQDSADAAEKELDYLEEEPLTEGGVAQALKVAQQKGYLDKEEKKISTKLNKSSKQILAQNFFVEEKRFDDIDAKYQKRDRFSGPLTEFKEKKGYVPSVRLEYMDDMGHVMNEKEAFQFLSYKFHGRGPGKLRREKQQQREQEDRLVKGMSATDTPLKTLEKLIEKTKQQEAPYIVLTNKHTGNNAIAKITGK